MIVYNVIIYNINKKVFEPYNIIPYLVEQYNNLKEPPTTFDAIKQFIKKESMYMWWARCEYEIVLTSWPNKDVEEKWDIYKQIDMNIDLITKLFMDYVI